MNRKIPMIFGWFSLSGETRQVPAPEGAKTLYHSPKAAVYALAGGGEHYLSRMENGIRLVIGRMYEPVRVNPSEPADPARVNEIHALEPRELEGGFTLIEVLGKEDTSLRITADKFGFRRLLWAERDGLLYFSTHLKGMRELIGGGFEVSPDALLHFYNFGFTPGRETLLKGINKLRMGHRLTASQGTTRIEPYFLVEDLYRPEAYASLSEEDICARIDECLARSVRLRSPRGRQVAVALSGGVDSGYILQKIHEQGLPVKAYTLCYSGFYDEFKRVDFLSQQLGTPLEKITLEPRQIIETFEYVNGVTSEPSGFNNATMRLVAQPALADGACSLFDGDGCDRIFLGMENFKRLRRLHDTHRAFGRLGLLGPAKAALACLRSNNARKALLHFRNWSKGIDFYPERKLEQSGVYDQAYERRVHALSVAGYQKSLHKAFKEPDFGLLLTYQSINMCPEMFFFDPMDVQIELGLYPAPAYWDEELVSLALSLPTDMKLSRTTAKYILRQAAGRKMGKEYCMLPKIGLQNSYEFMSKSPEGREWRRERIEQAAAGGEYEMLREMVPGRVDPERLISLVVWKEQQGLGC